MAPYQPTLHEVATLLDAPASCAPNKGSVAFARWLILQSDAAYEFQSHLFASRSERPTLFELAKLLIALDCATPMPECRSTVVWLLQQTEPTRALYEELEKLREETGEAPSVDTWTTDVLEHHRLFARLLQAGDGWNDAAEVLDPMGKTGVLYEPLLAICRAHLGRSEGKRERLETIFRKLQRSAGLGASSPESADPLADSPPNPEPTSELQSTIRKLETLLAALHERTAPPLEA